LQQPELLLVLEFVLAFGSSDFHTNVKTFIIDAVIWYAAIMCFSFDFNWPTVFGKHKGAQRSPLASFDVFTISNYGCSLFSHIFWKLNTDNMCLMFDFCAAEW